MDKLVNFILSFFGDKDRGFLSKIALFSIALFLLLIIDNITGFSYYLDKSKKIDNLYKISILLNDTNVDIDTKNKIKILQKEILDRENVYLSSLKLLKNNAFISNTKNIYAAVQNNTRSEFLFVLTSSGFFIFMMLLTLIVIPFHQPKGFGETALQKFGAFVVFELVLYLISIAFYNICNNISNTPIFGNWWFNYLINSLLQISVIIFVPKLNKYAKS